MALSPKMVASAACLVLLLSVHLSAATAVPRDPTPTSTNLAVTPL